MRGCWVVAVLILPWAAGLAPPSISIAKASWSHTPSQLKLRGGSGWDGPDRGDEQFDSYVAARIRNSEDAAKTEEPWKEKVRHDPNSTFAYEPLASGVPRRRQNLYPRP